MIKQMMSSSENKQAGLGVNITKGNTAEDQNAKGIFGSILNSIQDFTKKEEDSKDAFGEGLSKDEQQKEQAVVQEAVVSQQAEQKNVGQEISTDAQENPEEAVLEEVNTQPAFSDSEMKSESVSKEPIVKQEEIAQEGNKVVKTGLEGEKKAEQELQVKKLPNYEVGSDTAKEGLKSAIKTETSNPSSSELPIESESKEVSGSVKIKSEIEVPIEAEELKNQSAPAKAKTEIQEEVSADEILEKAKAAEAERTSTEQRTVGDVLQKDNQPKIEKQVGEQSLKTEQVRNDQPSGSKTDVPLVGKVISEQATEVTKNIDAVQEIQTKKVEELQEKKFRQIYSFSARQELNTERLELVTNTTQSELTTASLSRFETAADFLNAKVKGSSAGMLSEEQELLIKNNLKESTELPDQKEASAMQFMRLGEMPISNFTIKRLVMPGLSQAVQKTVSAGKAMPETWQKHSFELEDGNSIQLSTREVDGVIQVKLASSNVELTRLMQQYEKEIKEYLQQDCQIDVNLQFDGGEEGQELAGFFGDPSSSGKKGNSSTRGMNSMMNSPKDNESKIQKSVRRFGYNQMEWTA